MNQFFYKRTEGESVFTDSFNVNKVIRTLGNADGTLLVLLDDLHERSHDVPDVDIKSNKVKGVKRQRDTYQSEITLSKEDAERFQSVTQFK